MDSSFGTAQTHASGGRKLPFWNDAFLELTAGAQSPSIFRLWASAMTIAGALERKVWLKVGKRILYPNLYALLVGGPGVGKSDALRDVERFWDSVGPTIHVAPSSVSRASLTDRLVDAERNILRPLDLKKPYVKFNSLQIAATEFGTFLTAYDGEFLSTLNHLYDCLRYRESKRAMKNAIEIDAPQLNLIAGTTPAWLSGSLPETAWAEGFCSRLIIIYSGERLTVDLFSEAEMDADLERLLEEDLKAIHALYGQMSIEEEVAHAVQTWYAAGGPPRPEHPKLEHYLPRRHTHLLKLCMVMSTARSDELVIRMIDYTRALDMLLEAELFMPDLFKSMHSSSDSSVMDETFNYVWTEFKKHGGKAIPEHRLIYFIQQRIPTHSVIRTLELMVSSGMLVIASVGERGRNTYRPAPRATHGTQ